jgi:hypothetical protein
MALTDWRETPSFVGSANTPVLFPARERSIRGRPLDAIQPTRKRDGSRQGWLLSRKAVGTEEAYRGARMRKNSIASLVLGLALGLSMIGCEDTKARQENEQLKTRVAELEKENGDLQKNVDGLTKDNAALAQENAQLKAKLAPKKKSSKTKKHKHKPAASSTN